MVSEHKGEIGFVGFAMVAYLVMASFDASQNFVYLAVIFGFLDSSSHGNFLKVSMMNRREMKK